MTDTLVQDCADLQARYELDVFGKRGISLVRGQGAKVWDDKGRSYIDAIGGQGAAALGHAHPRVIRALQEQARKLICCPGMFSNDARARYMERLVRAAPTGLDKVFFCNSGSEAVEAALKFARIGTGRAGVVAAKNGFHGRTFGAMSATANRKYAQGSEPLVPGFTHIPYNDIKAVQNAMQAEPAALILEIVQGEGGVIIGEESFFSEARRLCDEHGVYLIIDEVQTGFCRTGRLFACEHFQVRPDILCLAKAMAAGLPMGAVLVGEHVRVPVGRHGSTFGGNPLVCAVADTVLDLMIEQDLAGEASRKAEVLINRLQADLPESVREIRYKGLMIGIELKKKVRPVLKEMMEEGVLALPAGSTVLRLLPPLVIEREEIEKIADTIIKVLG
jgi:acetylornithine/LysW-gamma-L-lysine aminotransferase